MKKTTDLHGPHARPGCGFFAPSSPLDSWKLKRPQGPLRLEAAELSGGKYLRGGALPMGGGSAPSLFKDALASISATTPKYFFGGLQ